MSMLEQYANGQWVTISTALSQVRVVARQLNWLASRPSLITRIRFQA